jgi:tetratricopeptide (TPR) repeat protein
MPAIDGWGRMYFISYSPADALEPALRLHDALRVGPPKFDVWLDKRKLRAAFHWDSQLADALAASKAVLFVMTPDSVGARSRCRVEWSQALQSCKPVYPLRFDRTVSLPLQLSDTQWIDFTGDFEDGLAALRQELTWLESPEGEIQLMRWRLLEAERERLRSQDPIRLTALDREIAGLKAQLTPQGAPRDQDRGIRPVDRRFAEGMAGEEPTRRVRIVRDRIRFLRAIPDYGPDCFQDRNVQTDQLEQFLSRDDSRVATIIGRPGIGKTAMLCRLLKRLEDAEETPELDAVAWFAAQTQQRLTTTELLTDLGRLLAEEDIRPLDLTLRSPHVTPEAKLGLLIGALRDARVLVVIDNFEELIDPITSEIRDHELQEVLRTLLHLPRHGVKVVLTTRMAPRSMLQDQPARQLRLDLPGLEFPDVVRLFHEWDPAGDLGLRTTPEAELQMAWTRTGGNPRALEKLYAILLSDRDTSLAELLDDLLPETAAEALIGEAFRRLDPPAQLVLQALAVYGWPVPLEAVEYLLLPYSQGLQSRPILSRLMGLHLAAKHGERYFLPEADRQWIMRTIPAGDEGDATTVPVRFTQVTLLYRAAYWCSENTVPDEKVRGVNDLWPQLAEMDLRARGGDDESAFWILRAIDGRHLLPWGQGRLVLELHQRFAGKLQHPLLEQARLTIMGRACQQLGLHPEAIEHYQAALAIVEGLDNPLGQKRILTNLGGCYYQLGQTKLALREYERALRIAKRLGNKAEEAAPRSGICLCYGEAGEFRRAIDQHKRARRIAKDTGNRQLEAEELANLGFFHGQLGDTERGLALLEDAYTLAHSLGHLVVVGHCLADSADLLIDLDRMPEAIERANKAVQIGEEIGNPPLTCEGSHALALAHLRLGELSKARSAADLATSYSTGQSRSHAHFVLQGVIALRQHDGMGAMESFGRASGQAANLLEEDADAFAAWDSKGLALVGVAACGYQERLDDAKAAFRAARAITSEPGVVRRIGRLLDELVPADPHGFARELRPLATGDS